MDKNTVSCQASIMILTNVATKQVAILRNRGTEYFKNIRSFNNDQTNILFTIILLSKIAFVDEVRACAENLI